MRAASRPRRPRRRRLGALLALVVFTAVCGGGLAWGDSPSTGGSDLTSQFGGFSLSSHAEGLTITYTSPQLIPGTPDQLAAVDLPEALTNMDNGPSGYALASLGYPGPLLADLPSALALMGIPSASSLPSWPLRAQAYYPAGPTTATQSAGPGQQVVKTDATTSSAQASFTNVQLSALLNIGSIASSSQSQLVQGQVVSRSRVQISGLDILDGLVHIGSLTTDLVATSNAKTAATSGDTVVGDVTLLGLPATIDATGVHLKPAASGTGTTTPTTTNPLLGPLTGALAPVAKGLSSLLQSTLGSVDSGVNALLNQGGISIHLVPATQTVDGADGSRLAGGLSIELNYNGKTEPVMSQLLSLIPVNQLPSQGIGPIPFSSPQALVQLLRATHIIDVGLAAATVHAGAAPPFTFPATPNTASPTTGGTVGGGFSGGGSLPSSTGDTGSIGGGFTTPVPSLAPATHSKAPVTASAQPAAFLGATPLAAAAGVLVALLVALAFAFGSRRLADDVLATGDRSCPDGLDQPPDKRSSS